MKHPPYGPQVTGGPSLQECGTPRPTSHLPPSGDSPPPAHPNCTSYSHAIGRCPSGPRRTDPVRRPTELSRPRGRTIGASDLRRLSVCLSDSESFDVQTGHSHTAPWRPPRALPLHLQLPKIRCAADANGLLLRLEALAKALVGLKDACEEAISSSSAAAGRSPARDAAGAAPVDDGKWLFALLRHTNSESARRVLTATLRAVERLSALGERVKVEGVVHVPDVLLCMVDGAAPSEDALRADGFPATDSEVLAEVQWRAHPEQRGFFKQLGRRYLL